jgi:phage gpG-like protein
MITAFLLGDVETLARLNRIGPETHQALLTTIERLTIRLQSRVKEKLSDDVLHVRTGKLRRSITRKIVDAADDIKGIVGTKTVYARIQEYGGQTAPHDIYPRNALALRFMGRDGNFIFAKVVHHPGSHIPARSFLRTALHEMEPMIRRDIERAARNAGAAAMKK